MTGLLLVSVAAQSTAQSEPATIPTVVAQAMSFEPSVLGRPRFFSGQTPPDWPADLIPARAKVVGGGVVGDSAMYRLRTAVFELSDRSNARDMLSALISRAGYVRPASAAVRTGGFVATQDAASGDSRLCKGSTMAMYAVIDSVRAPRVVAVDLLDGEAGRQNCAPQRDAPLGHKLSVDVPPLSPPPGAMSFGGGSSWSGSSGNMRSELRTTMPADSVLAHYSTQLAAGGWKQEGRPGIADGVGVQRFLFREGQDSWTAALIILPTADGCEVLLELARVE